MKKYNFIPILFFSISILCVRDLRAETVVNELNTIQSEVAELESEREGYERELNDIEGQFDSALNKFENCSNDEWRVFWRLKVERMNESWGNFNRSFTNATQKLVDDLREINSNLESERLNIESESRSQEEYDRQMLDYIAEFRKRYIQQTESSLFQVYKIYFRGVRQHVTVVNRTAEFCESGNKATLVDSLLLDHISELESAISEINGF